MQLPYMNELYSSLHCTVKKLYVTPHIGIPYSPLSFDIYYFGFVLFDKDPSSVHGAWVHGEDFVNHLMNEQLSKLSI